MPKDTTQNKKDIWDLMIGDKSEFPMENRLFNYICLVAAFLLIIFFFVDIFFINETIIAWVSLILLVILIPLFYFSRIKKNYKKGVLIMGFCSYAALILDFIYAGGINGPALMTFFLNFIILSTLEELKYLYLWIILHLIIGSSLLYFGNQYPERIIPYENSNIRIWDIGITYFVCIIIIYFIIHFLRKHYYIQKANAEERAISIEKQNEKITEQNKKLETLNQEKNKMFSIISHDLTSPINSIQGYLELLNEPYLSEEDRRSMNEELVHQTKYTSQLLQNLLAWSKSQMHGVNVNLTTLKLGEIINITKDYNISFAARKGINLDYTLDTDLKIVADKELMYIVIRNLINNAIKFTKDGGTISINATQKGKYIEIAIKDTGIGIPYEKQKDIFTLKTQSTYGTQNEKGVGLGLLIVKEFVELQHGFIRFESILNEGTTFFITLPKAQ